MKQHSTLLSGTLLMLIPACGGSMNSQSTIERIIAKSNNAIIESEKEFGSGFKAMKLNNKKERNTALKTAVSNSTKAWYTNSSWFRMSWLNFTTSLNDYRDIPFHAYEYAAEGKMKTIASLRKKLEKIAAVDLKELKQRMNETEQKLRKLCKYVNAHDRYAKETDTISTTRTINNAALAISNSIDRNTYYNRRYY